MSSPHFRWFSLSKDCRRTMKMPMKRMLLFCSILTLTNAQWTAQTNETSSYSPSSFSSSFQPYVSYLIIASKVIRPNTFYKVRINRNKKMMQSNFTSQFKEFKTCILDKSILE